jgi:hypothetical protein
LWVRQAEGWHLVSGHGLEPFAPARDTVLPGSPVGSLPLDDAELLVDDVVLIADLAADLHPVASTFLRLAPGSRNP